ncbi:MAG TPA: metallopeptidase TldD-related protein [Terriglobales bacterium]|nr:metallopeptidase TldD-related protein [Terriglobales bacterium]
MPATEEIVELGTGLKQIAADVVARAMKAGASSADAIARDGNEFSTLVRLGQVETLKESGARALGLRVFVGKRAAATHTSDFSREGVDLLVSSAITLARTTSEDPHAGLPDSELLGSLKEDLDLYYADVYSLSTADRIDYAKRTEAAALAVDARITNSEGGSFDAATGYKVLANSLGFVGEYRRSYCSVSAVPIAQLPETAMQRDYWYSASRTLQKLDSPEDVGRKAAERTLRRLGAKKVSTQKVPIVFDPMVSRGLIDHLFDAVNGDSIYRHASFLAGKLGEQVAGENITIVDDGTMRGGFGSSPFDGEGVPTRRTVVIERGVLKSYLLNTYTARKLGLKTTGNAARGLTGNPGIGSGNFYLQPGETTPQEILRGIRSGLYVTEFLGFGVNLVTGDFSRGASGLWIENGELTYPVEEITVAGNLKEMFRNISAIGNDLEFRSSIAAPTIRIDGMTVAGE